MANDLLQARVALSRVVLEAVVRWRPFRIRPNLESLIRHKQLRPISAPWHWVFWFGQAPAIVRIRVAAGNVCL